MPDPQAQTTTSDSTQTQITPNTPDQGSTPAQPTQPSAPATTPNQPPAPAAPNQPNTPAAKPPQQDQPHPMSKIFNGILKTITGGPIMVTDPTTGERREVPQTKGQMGRAILAGALAGLMTPTQYRNTPYGPAVDHENTDAAAMSAGAGVRQKREQGAQQITNDQKAAKLFTFQNNAKLVQQAAAMAHQKHEVLADTVARNNDIFMKPLQEFDKNRPADMPDSIFLNKGMSSEQVLSSGHSLTDNNVIIDGMMTKPNPQTGVLEDEPTYAVINNKANLKLPKEVTDELGKFNKNYAKAFDLTGGSVNVPINAYMDAVHTANSLSSVEHFLNRAQKEINPKAKGTIDLAAAYKENPAAYQSAVDAAEKALAAGNGRPDGGDTDNVLRAIRGTSDGGKMLDLLGKPEDVDKWMRDTDLERQRQNALAKEGGVGDKAPIAKPQQDAILGAINDIKDPTDRKTLQAMIPEDRQLTTGEAERIGNRITQVNDKQKQEDLRTGDPAVLDQTADSMLNGSMSNPKDLATIRSGGARMMLDSLLQRKAAARGLDPVTHGFTNQELRAKTYGEYSDPNSKIGAQLSSFDTLMRHTAEALDANESWVRSGSPLLNHPLSWIAENAANDQNYQTFKDTIIAPLKEYMNFLNQNRAEHESDIRSMEGVLGKDATAQTALTALKAITSTADARAAGLGWKYQNTVNQNYPGLISPSAVSVMNHFGIKSQSGPMSVELPRGWQNNSGTVLNPQDPQSQKVVKMFVDAAGGNADLAKKLLKENGWK